MNWQLAGAGLVTLLWVVSLGRLRLWLGRARDGVRRAEFASFCAATTCLTLQLPTLSTRVDALLGAPGVARLLANLAGVYAAWSFYACITALWQVPARARGPFDRASLMGATAVALIMLFRFAPAPAASMPARLPVTSPFTIYDQSLAYTLVYMGYLGGIASRVLAHSARWLRRVDRSALAPRLLRSQLRLQTVGWAAGVVYAAHEVFYALLRSWQMPYPLLPPAFVSNGLLALALIGATSSEWQGPRSWLSRYRCHRALYPLWRLVYTATPTIALPALFSPSRSSQLDALALNDISLRLLRRVVEIQDGLVALWPFRDERVARDAEGVCERASLPDQQRRAEVEASVLVAASGAKRAGMPSPDGPSRGVIRPSGPLDTFEAEVAWLRQIADAVAHSPIDMTIGTRAGIGVGPATDPACTGLGRPDVAVGSRADDEVDHD